MPSTSASGENAVGEDCVWRKDFAERNAHLPPGWWGRVIVCDEKTYYGQFTGTRWIWRRRGQRYLTKNMMKKAPLVQTRKAHVFGAMSAKGPLPLQRVSTSPIRYRLIVHARK